MFQARMLGGLLPLLLCGMAIGEASPQGAQEKSMINEEKRMFLLLLKYVKPLEQVDEFVPAHVEFLKACYERGLFVFSGPRIPRTGGIILANVDSLEAVWALIKQDPFYIHQIAEFEVIEFKPWMYEPRFSCFIDE